MLRFVLLIEAIAMSLLAAGVKALSNSVSTALSNDWSPVVTLAGDIAAVVFALYGLMLLVFAIAFRGK